MATLYVTHPAFLTHEPPHGHPERPDRMRAIERRLEDERFSTLVRERAHLGTPDLGYLAHPAEYVDELHDMAPRDGLVSIDPDTSMSPGTWEALMRGAGAVIQASDEVLSRQVDNAFCAIRPPGHHAERVRAMGFCFLNNAAIAARHVQHKHGIGRVAIIDFDVHHGNGTQDIFWEDKSVMYASTHQMPCYPGTGARAERGVGNIVNCPLRPGEGSEEFIDAFDTAILPALDKFAPEFVIISAGFDAHARDPLAQLNVHERDFGLVTRRLMDIADKHAGSRLVSVLEGGYDLEGLARSVDSHVSALMGM